MRARHARVIWHNFTKKMFLNGGRGAQLNVRTEQDLSEEWSLPMISCSLYFFTKYAVENVDELAVEAVLQLS